MFEPIALTALAIDAVIGWPSALHRLVGHPVGFFAAIIEWCENKWNCTKFKDSRRQLLGTLTVILLLVIVGGIAWVMQCLSHYLLGKYSWIAISLLAWPALAQHSLYIHVRPVATHLFCGDLQGARMAVSMIVGRDTSGLDSPAVARAAIESLAESFCDGIVAPLFWLLIGGLPGVWMYKAINTADSLIGHREERWRMFGWAAARTDDVANWLPARIGGVLICLAGGRGWAVMMRDARRHASPNAGWTEAATAGVLKLRLAGPVVYDDVVHDKEWIGAGRAEANASDIKRALNLYVRACSLLWLVSAFVIWGASPWVP